jgi:hypothetical protein
MNRCRWLLLLPLPSLKSDRNLLPHEGQAMSIPPTFSGNRNCWPHLGHVFIVWSVMVGLDLSESIQKKCARSGAHSATVRNRNLSSGSRKKRRHAGVERAFHIETLCKSKWYRSLVSYCKHGNIKNNTDLSPQIWPCFYPQSLIIVHPAPAIPYPDA